MTEDWKWRDVPAWYHGGMMCTGEPDKTCVKMTFAKGAHLDDPLDLFSASLAGNLRRAIDFSKGAAINEAALIALIRAASTLDKAKPTARKTPARD